MAKYTLVAFFKWIQRFKCRHEYWPKRKHYYIHTITVGLLILTRYRDRTVSVTKLWNQFSRPNPSLFTVQFKYFNLKLKYLIEADFKRF